MVTHRDHTVLIERGDKWNHTAAVLFRLLNGHKSGAGLQAFLQAFLPGH